MGLKRLLKKYIGIIILLGLLGGQSLPVTRAGTPPAAGPEKIAPALRESLALLQAGDTLAVIVRLKDGANLSTADIQLEPHRATRLKKLIGRLQTQSETSQKSIRQLLRRRQAEGRVTAVTPLWIFNGLGLTATPDVIKEVAERPEVIAITPNRTIQGPPPPAQSELAILSDNQPNLGLINVPALWEMGYYGQGIVVANLDTGVGYNNYAHPTLFAKWRGGSNSWFDPYRHTTIPYDVNGHGTRTMGVMIGDSHDAVSFGIAPQATWIAAKIFNDSNSATALAIHQAFQWILDPDGDPETADAPHVVNNSWTWFQGCDFEFQPDMQALRAAGILPIFAAGNSALTSHSPANYPEALAVGATDNSDMIWEDSSQGPSACDGTIFPEVVAPGVEIHTTTLYGSYYDATGTSLAVPHVAGALALLLNAFPDMTVEEQEQALINTAVDRGAAQSVEGADNTYGYGRIDVWAAHQSMLERLYLPIIIR